jgi:hypothetical protein
VDPAASVIILPDKMSAAIIQVLMKLIYCGEAVVDNADQLEEILQTGTSLKIRGMEMVLVRVNSAFQF